MKERAIDTTGVDPVEASPRFYNLLWIKQHWQSWAPNSRAST